METKFNWEKTWGIIRSIIMTASAWFLGVNLFGQTLTENLLEVILSAIGVVGTFVWTILSKEVGIEQFQGFLRQLITAVGAMLLSFGWLKEETLVIVMSLLPILVPPIYAWFSRLKSQKIANNEIQVAQLNGVTTTH